MNFDQFSLFILEIAFQKLFISFFSQWSLTSVSCQDLSLFLLCRNASCNIHSPPCKLWPDPQSWWNPHREPPLLQLARLQWGHHRSRLPHGSNPQQPREHGRVWALSVQQPSAGEQHSALLQEPQPGSMPLGVYQLLPHVRAALWLWRSRRDWRTGVCVFKTFDQMVNFPISGFIYTSLSVWLCVNVWPLLSSCLYAQLVYSLLNEECAQTEWHQVCLPALHASFTACLCLPVP